MPATVDWVDSMFARSWASSFVRSGLDAGADVDADADRVLAV